MKLTLKQKIMLRRIRKEKEKQRERNENKPVASVMVAHWPFKPEGKSSNLLRPTN